MATVELEVLQLGPQSNGMSLSPWEFDAAEFEPGWRYELVNGVLIVNPPPSLKERDPNEELGRWLRNYQESHPQGSSLDFTVSEQTVHIGANRRRVIGRSGRASGAYRTTTKRRRSPSSSSRPAAAVAGLSAQTRRIRPPASASTGSSTASNAA